MRSDISAICNQQSLFRGKDKFRFKDEFCDLNIRTVNVFCHALKVIVACRSQQRVPMQRLAVQSTDACSRLGKGIKAGVHN